MKRFLFFLMTMFFTFSGVKAQENTTDYIYSSDGFEVKTSVYVNSIGHAFLSSGLYSKDGKVLVSAISTDYSSFYVLDGCETICSGAFQGQYGMIVYIPSSVKNIAPDALIPHIAYSGTTIYRNRFGGIQDGVREELDSAAAYTTKSSSDTEEVARYSINGIKLNEPTAGVNIIQKSDGTSEKVLVK